MTLKRHAVESINNIEVFNDVAGNLTNVGVGSVEAQLSFIMEELKETIKAVQDKDPVELLDGSVDVWVTTVGLLLKLEKAGFNVADAMYKVDKNNMSKYPQEGEVFDLKHDQTVTYNEQHEVFVIKNLAGKIQKPSTFKPVNLEGYENPNFFE